ncbi:LOW QUALITY PROTEIN: hypothetical protein ElyMa_001207200 [Elysia marginata]|uniref:Uncharacterized protein n=1 Tax=Elysia marginata TaxID=1093978 RepID=A0AAV4I5J2_9GAST|nr:LOW QUALITY PROTEIN: hypothetical protein ElyMa_001207200 [Elysia marginata]
MGGTTYWRLTFLVLFILATHLGGLCMPKGGGGQKGGKKNAKKPEARKKSEGKNGISETDLRIWGKKGLSWFSRSFQQRRLDCGPRRRRRLEDGQEEEDHRRSTNQSEEDKRLFARCSRKRKKKKKIPKPWENTRCRCCPAHYLLDNSTL